MAKWLHNMTDARSSLNIQKNDDLLVEINEDQRSALQREILTMYKDLLQVCKQYNITPYLIGGSALGAVRHKGFIPWDDDIDVGMSRKDYAQFVRIFENKLSDKYILNAPNISEKPKTRFTKIIKKGTIFREVTDLDNSENGIFLDIFIIENIPRNKVLRKIKGSYCNLLQFISSQVYLYENDNEALRALYSRSGEENYKSRMRIGRVFSFVSSVKWFNMVDKAVQYRKETGIYGITTGRKHYFGEIFEEKVFFPAKYKDFEDIKAPVFNDTDTYLTNLYHNYMDIPSEDKRERHYVVELKF